jgi:hypothetical protein
MTTAIIALAGRALCPKMDGVDYRADTMIPWRAEAAADLSLELYRHERRAPLVIIAGDGASRYGLAPGYFNEQTADLLRSRGVEHIAIADNRGDEHTRGDMRASVSILLESSADRVIVVTCWYHIPRSLAVLHDEFRLAGVTLADRPAIRGMPVWRDIAHGLDRWRDLRRGEPRGTLDALLGNEQVTRRVWR